MNNIEEGILGEFVEALGSRRSGSMAASSRTILSRVFHFAYLLPPIPIASSAEMIQTVMSVAVTRRIKKRKPLETTDEK